MLAYEVARREDIPKCRVEEVRCPLSFHLVPLTLPLFRLSIHKIKFRPGGCVFEASVVRVYIIVYMLVRDERVHSRVVWCGRLYERLRAQRQRPP
jgi:hypothetical protein